MTTQLAAGFLAAAALMLGGCESNNSGNAARANASQSAIYAPGTGVSSSSYDRHPRFYTGANARRPAAPATQPPEAQ
jgi:hypothetical protein